MKALLLFGGLLGFVIGLAFSWAQGSTWPNALWKASLVAYLTGLLMRWWGRAWRKNLERALIERQSATASIKVSTLSNASKT
jgi:hypothetical protein